MKKRIIIPIVGQGSIMSIIRTGLLDELKESYTVVVALSWKQEDLIAELQEKGFEITFLPKVNF